MSNLLPPPQDLPFCRRFPAGHEAGIQMCRSLASGIRVSRGMVEASEARINELLDWLKKCLDTRRQGLADQAKEHLADTKNSLDWNRGSAENATNLANMLAPPDTRCLSCVLDSQDETNTPSNSGAQKV